MVMKLSTSECGNPQFEVPQLSGKLLLARATTRSSPAGPSGSIPEPYMMKQIRTEASCKNVKIYIFPLRLVRNNCSCHKEFSIEEFEMNRQVI